LAIQWTNESILAWRDGEMSEASVRAAGRWRLRVLSDRLGRSPRAANYDAIFARRSDEESFGLWVRPFGSTRPYGQTADGGGMSIQIVEDITSGLRHEVSVRVKPGDEATARWSCSCGTTSRHAASPELMREEAEAHAAFATDTGRRLRDRAVAQREDGVWSDVDVAVIQRHRACIRSEISPVAVHRKGIGEEFELVVDGRLGLWTRLLCSEAALRRDVDGRGVSLLTLDPRL
jgi:hypothetical protein